jgi:hypothetical protein
MARFFFRVFVNVVAVIFKVFFSWKYIKIIYFLLLKNYFNIDILKQFKYIKKINFNKKNKSNSWETQFQICSKMGV